MRLDKYLKVSRLIKRRTVANEVADAGRILINGKVAKASQAVNAGDIIEVTFGNRPIKVRVLSDVEPRTKDVARDMVFAANQAGCGFLGRPLVEATGSLRNFRTQAQIGGTDEERAADFIAEHFGGILLALSGRYHYGNAVRDVLLLEALEDGRLDEQAKALGLSPDAVQKILAGYRNRPEARTPCAAPA